MNTPAAAAAAAAAVVVDVETTGTHPGECRIIQLGAVALCIDHAGCLRVTGVLDVVVNPGNHVGIPEHITELTGLTRSDVNNGVSMSVALEELQQMLLLLDTPGHRIIGGHNTQFDFRFLGYEAQRIGKNIRAAGQPFCTMSAARNETKRTVSLSDLAGSLRIHVPQAHNAFCDAAVAARCMKILHPALRDFPVAAEPADNDNTLWGRRFITDGRRTDHATVLRQVGLVLADGR